MAVCAAAQWTKEKEKRTRVGISVLVRQSERGKSEVSIQGTKSKDKCL